MGLECHVKGTAKMQAAEFYQATEFEGSIPKKKEKNEGSHGCRGRREFQIRRGLQNQMLWSNRAD